jgi:hypothetical protein
MQPDSPAVASVTSVRSVSIRFITYLYLVLLFQLFFAPYLGLVIYVAFAGAVLFGAAPVYIFVACSYSGTMLFMPG